MDSDELWNKIRNNEMLQVREREGFKRGEARGKHMDYAAWTIFEISLVKQWNDLFKAMCTGKASDKMRCIADLRNVAGCLFLKVEEEMIEDATEKMFPSQ